MAPIAKSAAHRALEFAARTVLNAPADQKNISGKEVQTALKTLPGPEKAVVTAFFELVQDGFSTAHPVSEDDVARAMKYAKKHLLKRYPLDLSDEEMEEMSHAGKAARKLAKALKAMKRN